MNESLERSIKRMVDSVDRLVNSMDSVVDGVFKGKKIIVVKPRLINSNMVNGGFIIGVEDKR